MEFNKIGNAASKAYGKIDKAVGSDLDLELYSKMNDEAFQALASEYGEDNIVAYIKEMEYRRLTNAKDTQA